MKTNKFFAALLMVVSIVFFACNDKNTPSDPSRPQNPEDTTKTNPSTPTGDEFEVITIAQAIEMINAQAAAWQSDKMYQIEGTLTQMLTKAADIPDKYQNINFILADNGSEIKCYYTNNLGNAAFTSADQIPTVNSRLVVVGYLKNYVKDDKSTPEIINGYIKEVKEAAQPADVKEITIAEAIEIVNGLQAGGQTTESYRLKGVTVTSVTTKAADVPGKYTNINMFVQDATGTISCYYTNYLENKPFTSADQIPAVGTVLSIVGPLKSYVNKNTQEVTPEVLNGYIEEIIKAGEGPTEGGVKTIAEALAIIDALAEGGETTEVYTVTGEVESVITTAENLEKYGNVDFWMKDADGNKLEGFRITEPNGGKVTVAPEVGSTVTVKGTLMKYKNAKTNEIVPEIKGEFVK